MTHAELASLVSTPGVRVGVAVGDLLLEAIRDLRQDPVYFPHTIQDGPETFWVIETPSRIRQTRFETYTGVLVSAFLTAYSSEVRAAAL